MVKHVRTYLVLLVLGPWLLSIPAYAGQLQLDLAENTVELGLPLHVDLYAVDNDIRINQADWTSLETDFAVDVLDNGEYINDKRWPDKTVQHSQALLTARRTGQLRIPSILLGDDVSPARTVEVVEGHAGGKPISVIYSTSTNTPWQRQQVLVTATITTPEKFASLHADTLRIENAEVYPLPAEREFNLQGGSTLRVGWAIFPLVSGKQSFILPGIDYRVGGRVVRRYHLPPVMTNVRALPVYLSPTMPVGKLSIQSSVDPGRLLRPDNLAYLNVSMQGTQISPSWIPPVLRQLKSGQAIEYLPSSTERELGYAGNGLTANVVHTVPFKLRRNGSIKLPSLQLQYFDPDHAKVVTIRHTPVELWSINLAWRGAILLILFVVVIRVGLGLYRTWGQWRSMRVMKKQALQRLSASTNAAEIRHSLRLFANSEGWTGNLGLQHWQKQFADDPVLHGLLVKLSELGFSSQPTVQLSDARHGLLEYLRGR